MRTYPTRASHNASILPSSAPQPTGGALNTETTQHQSKQVWNYNSGTLTESSLLAKSSCDWTTMHLTDELGPVREPIVIGDTTYYKHPTHWFSDGNVIFIIEDTPAGEHMSHMLSTFRESISPSPSLAGKDVSLPPHGAASYRHFLVQSDS